MKRKIITLLVAPFSTICTNNIFYIENNIAYYYTVVYVCSIRIHLVVCSIRVHLTKKQVNKRKKNGRNIVFSCIICYHHPYVCVRVCIFWMIFFQFSLTSTQA